VSDRGGMLDLPPGFQYRVLSEEGGRLSDGSEVPGSFDGMAALPGGDGQMMLVRNHELGADDGSAVPARTPFDRDGPGGTTTLVVGRDRRVVREVVTSSGTIDNCAGGATPWGTWITCEEDLTDGHGYAFEVDPREPESELSRTPIRAMGTLHEAIAIDPRTGVVYLTDNSQGSDDPRCRRPVVPLPVRPLRPATPARGAAARRAVAGPRARGARRRPRGSALRAALRSRLAAGRPWGAPRSPERRAAHSSSEPKAVPSEAAPWFADTLGGEAGRGQLFRYRPRTETLELFQESGERSRLEQPDNTVVAPWGDLVVCSDSRCDPFGMTPEGGLYPIARSRLADSELCGPTCAADGRTLFLNAQYPGVTYAIWGPFGRLADLGRERALRDRRARMATAAPPPGEGPAVSAALAEAARRHGLTRLEAAAYDRLGAAL